MAQMQLGCSQQAEILRYTQVGGIEPRVVITAIGGSWHRQLRSTKHGCAVPDVY